MPQALEMNRFQEVYFRVAVAGIIASIFLPGIFAVINDSSERILNFGLSLSGAFIAFSGLAFALASQSIDSDRDQATGAAKQLCRAAIYFSGATCLAFGIRTHVLWAAYSYLAGFIVISIVASYVGSSGLDRLHRLLMPGKEKS